MKEKKFYQQPTFWIVVAVLGVVGLIYNAFNPVESNDTTVEPVAVEETTGTTEAESEAETVDENVPDQADYEAYCEDRAALLIQWGNISANVDIANVANYWSQFAELGAYDSEGNMIYSFVWHGLNKATRETVYFTCHVSGASEDDMQIHQFDVDDVTVDGSSTYAYYDENGQQVRDSQGCYIDGSGNC